MAISARRIVSACAATVFTVAVASVSATASPSFPEADTDTDGPVTVRTFSDHATSTLTAQTNRAGATAIASGDDYPYKTRSMKEVDPWNFYFRQCTSFVAWRMRQFGTKFTNTMLGGRWGDAYKWPLNEPGGMVIFQMGGIPRVRSIAWWGVSKSHTVGHVAIVTKTYRDGSVLVEDYNSDNHGHYHAPYKPSPAPESFIDPIFISPEQAWTRDGSGHDQKRFIRGDKIQYTVMMRNLAGLQVKGELHFQATNTTTGNVLFDWKTPVAVPGKSSGAKVDDPVRLDTGYYVPTSISTNAETGTYKLEICFSHPLPGVVNPCAIGEFQVG